MRLSTLQKTLDAYLAQSAQAPDAAIAQVPDTFEEFCETLVIDGGALGYVPFKLYPFQRELIELIKERSVMLFKVRQIGATLTCSIFLAYEAIRHRAKSLIISKTGSDSSEVVKDLRRLIYSNPDLKALLVTDNLTDLEFVGGGRIKAVAPVADSAGRSLKSVKYLLLDEAQSIEALSSVKSAAAATQTTWETESRTIILGTPPESRANDYWEMFGSDNGDMDAEQAAEDIRQGDKPPFYHWVDEGGWAKCLVHWKADPTKASNPNYLEDTRRLRKLDTDQLNREYNLKIPSDQETAIFPAELVNSCHIDPEDIPPIEEHDVILMGVDTAWEGSDYFVAISIRKTETHFEVIDLFRDRGRTLESYLANVIERVDSYNPFTIGVESNNGGDAVYQRLCSAFPGKEGIEKIFTSQSTKPSLISRLKLAMEMGQLKFPKGPLSSELLNFVRKPNGKLEAFRGNDDIVMSTAIALGAYGYDGSNFDRANWFN